MRDLANREKVLRERQEVKSLLNMMIDAKSFSVLQLRRGVHRLWQEQNSMVDQTPDGRVVTEMFDPIMMQSGSSIVESPLQVEAFRACHIDTCDMCRPMKKIHDQCYFSHMLQCISNGWVPPIDQNNIQQQYGIANSRKVQQFSGSFETEFGDILLTNVLTEISKEQALSSVL